jgi:hypothetical protein
VLEEPADGLDGRGLALAADEDAIALDNDADALVGRPASTAALPT